MLQTIMAHKPTQISNISYQVITCDEYNIKYILAVNILLDNKIIEKIKLKNTKKEYSQEFAKEIAFDYLKKKLIKPKKKNTTQKVNNTAKSKAASNLMKDLNL